MTPTQSFADTPVKCALKAFKPSRTQRGYISQHTRGIILLIVFDLQLIVVISDSQSTKHRVTLFHYVASNPAVPSNFQPLVADPQLLSSDVIATKLYLPANIRINLETTKKFGGKKEKAAETFGGSAVSTSLFVLFAEQVGMSAGIQHNQPRHCLNKSSTSLASYTRPSSKSRSESS